MLPFSPLKTWGLGLVSWVLLAAGVYCIWVWAAEPKSVTVERHTVPDAAREDDARMVVNDVKVRHNWPFLAAGIGMLAISFGGFMPVSFLLGKSGDSTPRVIDPGQVIKVDRPDGSQLHVEVFGANEKPTIVFTHGWSLNSSCWGYQQRALAKRFRIVLWDLPGLGQSKGPPSGDYSIDKMARDLEAVVQVAGKGPIILVGHSIGGMITQTLCRLLPEMLGPRVAGVVLLHTTYTNPLRTAFLAPLWTALEKPLLVPLNYLMMWLAPLAWLQNLQSYLNGSLHIATRISSFAGEQTRQQVEYGARLFIKAWPGVVARGNLEMLRFDELGTLPDVDIPVLVIGSKYDRLTKCEASEEMENKLAQGVLATVPAGHLGLWEQHTEVNQLLIEFVERLTDHKGEGRDVAVPNAVVAKD